MTDIAAPLSRPSLLRVLRYYVEQFGSVVDPLVAVEFLVDMAAFLGPHTQDRCRSGTDVEIMWPMNWQHGLKIPPDLQANPSHILVRFIAHAPVTSASNSLAVDTIEAANDARRNQRL